MSRHFGLPANYLAVVYLPSL